jgi:glucosamine kinase
VIQHFYVGVDGGATKTAVRVEDANGKLLGQVIGGPANIRISVDQAWLSINEALHRILHPVGVSFTHGGYQFHAGIGLAGYEIAEARDSFEKYTHGFNKLVLTSDAHIACLGAHNNNDGAIIIAGTGVVGFQMQAGETHKVSGWGFPHDDQGGGAWLYNG